MENEELEKMRLEIESIDKKIIQLFCDRQKIAQKIGKVKKELNLPIVDEKQKRKVFETRLKWAEEIGLSCEDTKDLFDLLHQKSVNIQNIKSKNN